jgi:ribonuclease HII
MCAHHERWPVYGFDRHKGYGTAAHLEALAAHGPCPIHRRSFRPVRVESGAAGQGEP